MNGAIPGQVQTLTIHDILQIRLTLEQIPSDNRSKEIHESITRLDQMIHTIILSFNSNKEPVQ